MLLYMIGFIIIGASFIKRGNTLIEDAQSCKDDEERRALQALGQKRVRTGKIIIALAVASTVGVFILLSMV